MLLDVLVFETDLTPRHPTMRITISSWRLARHYSLVGLERFKRETGTESPARGARKCGEHRRQSRLHSGPWMR